MNQPPFSRNNPFEPAKLSPIWKMPVARALPYDLTWDDLRVHLPGFNEQADMQAQVFDTYDKQGLNGGANSCILTLCYPTEGNQLRSETVFIKRTVDPRRMEARKYRYLASQGIPTPRLLADIHKDGAEIILLEFLPTIGIDFQSPREVNDLLHLLAQLNSITNPPDFCNPSPGVPKDEYDERVRSALTEISTDQALPFEIDVTRWFEAYLSIQDACQSLPLALNHNEFYFQQVGWAQRELIRQLVIFDLETMSLADRFTDIAGILKRLSDYSGRDQHELFKIYYERSCQLSQLEKDIDEAFHECKLVETLGAFYNLPWLIEEKGSRMYETIDDSPAKTAMDLHDDLRTHGLL